VRGCTRTDRLLRSPRTRLQNSVMGAAAAIRSKEKLAGATQNPQSNSDLGTFVEIELTR
jgi:hypothetical protein